MAKTMESHCYVQLIIEYFAAISHDYIRKFKGLYDHVWVQKRLIHNVYYSRRMRILI